MTNVTITERGWAAYFVCRRRCLYRRNTLVSGPGGRFIVSSVGNMHTGYGEMETIGCGRYYETMVFTVAEDGPYLDIDNQVSDYDGPWSICADSPGDLPNDVDNVADKMHEDTVAFYAKRVEREGER